MKKTILKSFVGGLVFVATVISVFYLANARSGLTSSPGDKLTSATWNSLVNMASNPSHLSGFTFLSCLNGASPCSYAGGVLSLNCPAGTTAIAGGCNCPNTNNLMRDSYFQPARAGWHCVCGNAGAGSATAGITLICGNVN